MFIYVVKTGESLYTIARKYEVSMDSIRIINGLKTDRLVPGQDLLIPSNMYIVQPGDSIYSIAQMSFISANTIRIYNRLNSDYLIVGMRLYLPPRRKYLSENFGFVTPRTSEENEKLINDFAPISTYFSIFEYHFFEDASLSTLNDTQMINLARNYKVAPLAVITNLTPTGFSPYLTKLVLNSPTLRNRLINNIIRLIQTKNFSGVNIDFELVQAEDRDLYSGFLRALRERLSPLGYLTSASVPAKADDSIPWLKGYDYGGIGAAVDFVFLMAYDFHEYSSPPGPVAPINEVRRTVSYALSQIGRNKIMLGVPRYGYNWTLSADGTVENVRAVSVEDAVETAMKYEVPIQYSKQYAQAYYQYRDENRKYHIVWYENAAARTEKLKLVVNNQLRGVGAWQIGLRFPQSNVLIKEFLITKKIL